MMSDSQLLTIAKLMVAAKSYRDHWLPLCGTVESGFLTVDDAVDMAMLHSVDCSSDLLAEAWGQLQVLLADENTHVLDESSAAYPQRLRVLNGRPAVLFTEGNLVEPALPPLAIVGSRGASLAGRSVAYEIAHSVSNLGLDIVSGLALGIDSAAHEGALDAGGRTLAVMGTGLGVTYPRSNVDLAKRINRQGALVTQFPPGQPPTKTSFPARNALIAALSDVTLVVEMSEKSGTRIEMNCAIKQGKTVLLWEPIVGNQPWLYQLAEHPQVRLVDSVNQVIQVLLGDDLA